MKPTRKITASNIMVVANKLEALYAKLSSIAGLKGSSELVQYDLRDNSLNQSNQLQMRLQENPPKQLDMCIYSCP